MEEPMDNDKKNEFIFKKLTDELALPKIAYDKAIKRYEDLSEWLNREESTLKDYNPHIFSQGSFRLGTAIKPLNGKNEYDLDLACKLNHRVSKSTHSQFDLKKMIGKELELYKNARSLKEDIKEKHRCWRLEYQDDLSFHMDIVPCIPESNQRKQDIFITLIKLSAEENTARSISDLTVSITDNRKYNYRSISDDWNISNPESYTAWFEKRMKETTHYSLKESFHIDNIPLFHKRTPLQMVIQLLKRHRDIMFDKYENLKPISIIITTLATKAYSGERNTYLALNNILEKMEDFIQLNTPRVPNPVNPREDFADKWSMPEHKDLKLEQNFWMWLEQAKNDFLHFKNATQPEFISKQASIKLGLKLDKKELAERLGSVNSPIITTSPKRHDVKDENRPWRSDKDDS